MRVIDFFTVIIFLWWSVSCIKVQTPPANNDVKVSCPKVDEKIYSDLRTYNNQLFNASAECQKNLKELSKDFANLTERNVYLESQTCNCPEYPQQENYCEGDQKQ